jgi:hypothetical protein
VEPACLHPAASHGENAREPRPVSYTLIVVKASSELGRLDDRCNLPSKFSICEQPISRNNVFIYPLPLSIRRFVLDFAAAPSIAINSLRGINAFASLI